MNEINIPTTDTECWIKYPKYRWVYETTKLFESQNKKWSFVKDKTFDCVFPAFTFNKTFCHAFLKYSSTAGPGELYTNFSDNINALHTEVIIQKGAIKCMMHHKYGVFLKDIKADIELRISAFIIMHFNKWNGVLSIKTIGNDIHCIKLMPSQSMLPYYPETATELINKIYKKKSKD